MKPLFHDPVRLRDVAFRVIRDLYALPPTTEEDLDALVHRIQGIHAGLNPEKEFFSLVLWLGRCAGIYAVEDLPPPIRDFKRELGPPDFIAVCRYKERNLPVLIEVKPSIEDELVWTEAYFSSRRRFAELLRLPLLVAWKHHGLWTLTDTEHFQKHCTAYHLSSEKALQESVMSMMFGDVMVALKEDFQFLIEATIAEPLPAQGLIPDGLHTFTLQRGGFRVADNQIANLPSEQLWLFMACQDEGYVERVGRDAVRIIHHPAPNSIFPLFRVLLAQIAWTKPEGQEINWNEEIIKGPFPSCGARFREALQEGLKLGTIRYVIEQVPNTIPRFLDDLK